MRRLRGCITWKSMNWIFFICYFMVIWSNWNENDLLFKENLDVNQSSAMLIPDKAQHVVQWVIVLLVYIVCFNLLEHCLNWKNFFYQYLGYVLELLILFCFVKIVSNIHVCLIVCVVSHVRHAVDEWIFAHLQCNLMVGFT